MEMWLERAEDQIYDSKGRDAVTPISILWRTFQFGIPMLDLYNVLRPEEQLKLDYAKIGSNPDKQAKAALFKFVHACVSSLGVPVDSMPTSSQIMGEDTTHFIKVHLLFLLLIGCENANTLSLPGSLAALSTSLKRKGTYRHMTTKIYQQEATQAQNPIDNMSCMSS